MENEAFLQKEIAPPFEGGALLNVWIIMHPEAKSKTIIQNFFNSCDHPNPPDRLNSKMRVHNSKSPLTRLTSA